MRAAHRTLLCLGQNLVEVNWVTGCVQLGHNAFNSPHSILGKRAQSLPELAVVSIHKVAEDVNLRTRNRGREFHPRHQGDPNLHRRLDGLIKPIKGVVIGHAENLDGTFGRLAHQLGRAEQPI